MRKIFKTINIFLDMDNIKCKIKLCTLVFCRFYIAIYNELSDPEFKKLIQKQYNYIKEIAKEGFY
ncbi:hypothetical protein [Clostridium estertheticum]|uniref:hypothetical protein n=1 Tax=Clostridium estertheticum TaxID=238834 RepID=UPI001CF2ECAE|nr:hypothetical protein [Clostridium estertheticum]MCB2361709.1 hypothetical protein [Clostridium estertheticum]